MKNEIHPTVIINGTVKFGTNNKILPYTILNGPLDIGDDNIIGPYVVIGSPGQDTRNRYYDSSESYIRIGNRNIIREFTAIQKPCYENITEIMDDVYIMQGVHIPHDAIIHNRVVITPMVVLAGICKILEGANLGMGCTVNQRQVVGQYSIVATGAAAMKNVKPFSKFIPNKSISVNYYAIEKFGFINEKDEIEDYVLQDIYPSNSRLVAIVDMYNNYSKCMINK